MAVDEKRRLIYELLVEARDLQKNVAAQKRELADLGSGFNKLQATAKAAFKIFGAGIALNFIKNAIDEVTKFNEQVKALGVGAGAAQAAFSEVQKTAFATGQSVNEVAAVYKAATEAVQAYGGSQKDAVELTEAFTRAAVAEGKSAAHAATQLETLGFAYERGAVKVKEFQTLLKDNEALQKAAEQALGKTTEELIKMAAAGEIGREELRKILDQFKKNSANLQINVTYDRLIESLQTLGKAFVAATAEASGLQDALKVDSDLKLVIEMFANLGKVIGGLIRIIANFIGSMVNVVRLFAQFVANPMDVDAIWERYKKAQNENAADIAAGWQSMVEGTMGTPGKGPSRFGKTHSEIRDEALARRRAEAEAEAKANAEADAKEAAREAKREQERQDKLKRISDDRKRQAAAAAAIDMGPINEGTAAVTAEIVALNDTYLGQQAEINAYQEKNNALLRVGAREYEQWLAANEENLEMLADAQAVVGQAFYNLFTGATRSAKQFFAEVLKGFAQILAAKAASSIASSIFSMGSSAASTGGGGSFIGPPDAKGSAYLQGHRMAFARGGVVSGPTNFAMAGGGFGLMGEAGPEAVMPLRRGSNGKLGVAGTMPNIQIVNNTGVAAKAKTSVAADRMQIVLEAASLGADMAEKRINRSLRTGYGQTAQSMKSTYAIPRRF